MSHYHSIRTMQNLSDLLQQENEVLTILPDMSELSEKIADAARQVLVRGASALEPFVNQVDTATTSLRRYRPRDIFAALRELHSGLTELGRLSPQPSNSFEILLGYLQRAEEAYDAFVSENYSRTAAFDVFKAFADLHNVVEGQNDLLISTLSFTSDLSETDEGVEIFLAHPESPREAWDKVQAFEEMYSVIAAALEVSEAEHPLRIVHLSLGSLWLKTAGELGVIRLLRKILIGPATDAYTTFSKEGKIRSIPRKLDGARALLELSDEMEKRGIETLEIKQRAKSAVEQLAASYERLVADENYIEVDGKALPVIERPSNLLSKPEIKRLGPGKTDVEEASLDGE